MSGHSKWSTIKRKKEATDQARGRLFSRLVRGIQVAVRTGGGANLDNNAKLRLAIEQARAANMPKDNIDRAVQSAVGNTERVEEVLYEGFGPGGVAVMIEAATDNRNRTAQEIKSILGKSGGSLAGPGSVSFNFTNKVPNYPMNLDETTLRQVLKLKEELEESEDVLGVHVNANV